METMTMVLMGLGGVSLLAGLGVIKTILSLRRVVSTNEVHIVQSAKTTTSYGKDTGNGNTYYEWPSWLPVIGVTKAVLPVNIFNLELNEYEAYDADRLPFIVDITAFFRISDSNIAAQRVASISELNKQLLNILESAARVILGKSTMDAIMRGRSEFGEEFTKEVSQQLQAWGVETVKNIELMDIRDSNNSSVIKNIMEKKKSFIEMESRTEVAKNKKTAEVAEIEARREVDLQKQEAAQQVGLRTVEAQRLVELQQQAKAQAVKEAEKLTKEKEMAVAEVQNVRAAEITQKTTLITAEQDRKTAVIKAEATKQTQVISAQAARETIQLNAEAEKARQTLVAEGQLESKRREAEGITLEGTARAEAEKALQLAPVQAQITLAKEIGENASYQNYLLTIRKIEASQAVGMEQAKALSAADIKVISNTGSPTSGLNSVMDLFSSQGGTQVGAMLEGLATSDVGQALVEKVVGTKSTAAPVKAYANGKVN
jgi:flotillin